MRALLFGVVVGLAVTSGASSARAQQTQVYSYDVHGRLTNAGSGPTDTTLYRYDSANNRTALRCCQPIGGWQVTADGFDPYFYLQTYPDIRAAGVDPYAHWLANGASENRQPNRYFQTAWYRTTYGLAPGVNPLTHYHTTGWAVGNNPSPEFSTTLYHVAYPDTSALDPLQHFLEHGYAEGRSAFPVP